MTTTPRELFEMFEDMDPDEPLALHFITHSEMHEAAQAAGIPVTCTQVNRALTIYETMLEQKIGVDPYLLFKALGRAAESTVTENLEDADKLPDQPIFH